MQSSGETHLMQSSIRHQRFLSQISVSAQTLNVIRDAKIESPGRTNPKWKYISSSDLFAQQLKRERRFASAFENSMRLSRKGSAVKLKETHFRLNSTEWLLLKPSVPTMTRHGNIVEAVPITNFLPTFKPHSQFRARRIVLNTSSTVNPKATKRSEKVQASFKQTIQGLIAESARNRKA